jgi:histidinol-phosphate/aromatic aminotransferase/cobyric acid decarboxylase-like protein
VSAPATSGPAHGGLLHDELCALGLVEGDILDFSVNVNPYGPCPEIQRAISAACIERYPDPSAMPARRAIGRWLDVPVETVIVASGAVDVLWTVARATLTAGDRVLIAEPAFSEMRSAALRAGAHVVELRARAEASFGFDEMACDALLREIRPRVAYFASPANPTGRLLPIEVVLRLARAHPATQLVVDLSFASLSSQPDDLTVHASEQVLWVRSLTKELSLPGLRVGFAVGPAPLIAALHEERPPWSVSAPAQAAAIAATTPEVRRFVRTSADQLLRDRAALATNLTAMGLFVHPSDSVYVLVDLGPRTTGASLRRALLERHRILVRDASSFGLPNHVRIAARPASDSARLLAALRAELEH